MTNKDEKECVVPLSVLEKRGMGGIINTSPTDKKLIDIFIEGYNKQSDPKHAGLRFNEGKLAYDLIDPFQIEALAKVYTMGAKKYGRFNWSKGQAWSTVLASLKRHIAEFEKGNDYDAESGNLHMVHAAWNALALVTFHRTYPQGDDREHRYMKIPKIGLDVDETICAWVQAYCARYNLEIPHCWNFDRLFSERMEELKNDKAFWLNLEPLINPADLPFEPAAYITSRVIPNEWTQEWLDKCGFPIAPVITVSSGSEKAEHIEKLGLNWFVDDRFETFSELNKRGICCFLMDAKHNQRYDVGSKRIKSLVELKERW